MLPDINIGNLIDNRYLIKKKLGQGEFIKTYLASDIQRFDELCIIKELININKEKKMNQKNHFFFEQEALNLYKIKHPQIPKFEAYISTKKRLFIIQEFINGKAYSQILNERISTIKEAFSELEVYNFLLQTLPILNYIHSMNIIHRNISLENIMFCNKQAKPVLIQFGVDKEQINKHFYGNYKHKQLSNLLVGKFGYSPPEQLCMGYSSPCSDLYSLGVCAIVLLTGKTPSMLINNLLEWEWDSYTNINKYLAIILKKILSEKPNERYQSAKEILTDIQALKLGQN